MEKYDRLILFWLCVHTPFLFFSCYRRRRRRRRDCMWLCVHKFYVPIHFGCAVNVLILFASAFVVVGILLLLLLIKSQLVQKQTNTLIQQIEILDCIESECVMRVDFWRDWNFSMNII